MIQRPNYFKIGLFVISASTLAVLMGIVLGAGVLFRKEVKVETYFADSVQGLDIGSPVKFRGVQIGQVEEMTLVRNQYRTDHRYVLIRMALRPEAFLADREEITREEIQREVDRGLRVRLGFQGVTGAAYIEADYLDPVRFQPFEIDWRPKTPYIPSAPSLITRVGDAIDGILRKMEKIDIDGLSGALERSLTATAEVFEEANIEKLSRESEQLLTELRQTNRHLDQVVQDLQLKPLVADAAAAASGLRQMVETAQPTFRQLLTSSAAAAENLRKLTGQIEEERDLPESLASFRQSMTRLDQLLAGQQAEVETAIENFRLISENLLETSEELKEHPTRILFGAPPEERRPGGRP